MNDISFNKDEKRLIGRISFLFALRSLGVSLILPLMSIYTMSMEHTTESLAGIAFAIFSISQTLLQIPMGKLSDKWGRKKTTILGLSIYLIGTILSALSYNIYHLIFARMLAGAGAVRGVTMAWLTDGIQKGKRNSALSYVGISIGAGVIIGFPISSIIAGEIGFNYLFYICAAITFCAIIYSIFCLHDYQHSDDFSIDLKKENITTILKNRDLLRINMIGFIESLCLTFTIFILPILIKEEMGIKAMWKIFAPLGVIGTCFMFYYARKADVHGFERSIIIAIIFAIIGTLFPLFFNNIYSFGASIIFIYSGHCILQPILPATISRYPNTQVKGTAMGIFISFQSIGSSLGGILGANMKGHFDRYSFSLLTVALFIALIIILNFKSYQENNNQHR